MSVVAIVIAVLCLLVLCETGLLLRNLAHLRPLSRLPASTPQAWPRVSVIMAARDEVGDVARAVKSRLADDYPDFEVILVDDRSTDGTGEAALATAGDDPRFSLVRVDDLPAGWLGKVHALQRGVEQASGEWLLFSDGDVTVEAGTLRRAVGCCVGEGIDLLALLPSFRSGRLLMDGIWAVFLRGLIVMVDPARVRDPKSKVVLGCGAFNLVRRASFEATDGFEHLRMETGDDVALAAMVKRAGGRVEVADGSSHAAVAIYRSIGELLRGVEKNGSTTATIPFPLLVLAFALLGALLFTPLAALAVGPCWLRALGALTFSVYTASECYTLWRNTRAAAPALLWPLGYLIMAYAMLRATWLVRRNGGVYWRDTFYTIEELTAGRRVKLSK